MTVAKTKTPSKPRRKTTRTNILLDDMLVKRAMQCAGVKTKREAVQAALESFTRSNNSLEELLALRGSGCVVEGYDPKLPYGGLGPGPGLRVAVP